MTATITAARTRSGSVTHKPALDQDGKLVGIDCGSDRYRNHRTAFYPVDTEEITCRKCNPQGSGKAPAPKPAAGARFCECGRRLSTHGSETACVWCSDDF